MYANSIVLDVYSRFKNMGGLEYMKLVSGFAVLNTLRYVRWLKMIDFQKEFQIKMVTYLIYDDCLPQKAFPDVQT